MVSCGIIAACGFDLSQRLIPDGLGKAADRTVPRTQIPLGALWEKDTSPPSSPYRRPAPSHGDPLLTTLAEALAHLVAAVDTSTDEEASPDAASRWFEYPAYLFDRLSPGDRHRLADLFRAPAMKEPEGS